MSFTTVNVLMVKRIDSIQRGMVAYELLAAAAFAEAIA